jgi:hypothetical protein
MHTVESAINRAKALAAEQGKTYAVITIDCGDGKAIRVCPDDYTYEAEFDAFDGRLLHLVHADGSVE